MAAYWPGCFAPRRRTRPRPPLWPLWPLRPQTPCHLRPPMAPRRSLPAPTRTRLMPRCTALATLHWSLAGLAIWPSSTPWLVRRHRPRRRPAAAYCWSLRKRTASWPYGSPAPRRKMRLRKRCPRAPRREVRSLPWLECRLRRRRRRRPRRRRRRRHHRDRRRLCLRLRRLVYRWLRSLGRDRARLRRRPRQRLAKGAEWVAVWWLLGWRGWMRSRRFICGLFYPTAASYAGSGSRCLSLPSPPPQRHLHHHRQRHRPLRRRCLRRRLPRRRRIGVRC